MRWRTTDEKERFKRPVQYCSTVVNILLIFFFLGGGSPERKQYPISVLASLFFFFLELKLLNKVSTRTDRRIRASEQVQSQHPSRVAENLPTNYTLKHTRRRRRVGNPLLRMSLKINMTSWSSTIGIGACLNTLSTPNSSMVSDHRQ